MTPQTAVITSSPGPSVSDTAQPKSLSAELLDAAMRPSEFVAMLRYKHKSRSAKRALVRDRTSSSPDWAFAYDSLTKVSRSFSLVIMELQPELRHPICVFYLVLRALDTVEDDTTRPENVRAELCSTFYKFLDLAVDADTAEETIIPWSSSEFGTAHEKALLQNFPAVQRCFASLKPEYRTIVQDITHRMGKGMAEHIYDVECVTVADYDLYCHYVAGLVGEGLSAMFAASGIEEEAFASRTRLSNSMGLFLQKTNIIRDYLEDSREERTFWPHEIWSNYASQLTDLAVPANRKFAMPALNHMVCDVLRHVPDCIEYMSLVRDPNVFNFVAIPQVMAIATIAECFNNGAVFERKVKIRRSLTALLVMRTKTMDALYKLFFDYAVEMLRNIEPSDPSAAATREQLNTIIDICAPHVPPTPDLLLPNLVSIVAFCGLSSYLLQRRADHYDGVTFTWRSAGGIMEPKDMLAVAMLFIVCIYLFSFFMLPYLTRAQMEEVRRFEIAQRNAERRLREEEQRARIEASNMSTGPTSTTTLES